MKTFYFNCPKILCKVFTDNNEVLIDVPPIFNKFKGQSLTNLIFWASKTFGKVVWKELE